jgi:subtilisin family serine protease
MKISESISNKKLLKYVVSIIVPLLIAGYFIVQYYAGADSNNAATDIPIDAELGFNTQANAPIATSLPTDSGVIAGKYIVETGMSVSEKLISASSSNAPFELSPENISKDGTLAKAVTGAQIAVKQDEENAVAVLAKKDSGAVIDQKYDGNIFNGFVVSSLSDAGKAELISSGYKVEPVKRVNVVLDTSVPETRANDVWLLKDINNVFVNGKGTKIGIIDTGVDYTHADLGSCTKAQVLSGSCAKVAGGYNFVNKNNDPMDNNGHGTHVAATAAGDGLLKGMAPKASIFAYKVIDAAGAGNSSDVIAALDRSIDPNEDGNYADRLDVVNLSLCDGAGNSDDFMSKAADKASSFGVTVVVAAGNNSNNGTAPGMVTSPGTARSAITVGAYVKGTKDPANFSSRGPAGSSNSTIIMKPDITAPGTSICAAEWGSSYSWHRCKDNSHVSLGGTSMASPHVAGAVALIKQFNPSWSPERIKQSLINTAIATESGGIKGTMVTVGAGQLNVNSAITTYRTQNSASTEFPVVLLDDSLLNPDATVGSLNISGKVIGDYKTVTVYHLAAQTVPAPTSWIKVYTREVTNQRTTDANGNIYAVLNERIPIESMLEGAYIYKLEVTNAAGMVSKAYSYQKINQINYKEVLTGGTFNVGQKIDLTVAAANYHDLDCNGVIDAGDSSILSGFASSNTTITAALINEKLKTCPKMADYLFGLMARGQSTVAVTEVNIIKSEIANGPVSYLYRKSGANQWTNVPLGQLDTANLAAGKYEIRVLYSFDNVRIAARLYEITFNASAQPSKVYVPDRDSALGTNVIFKGYLYRTDNTTIAGKTLQISLNDKALGSVQTDVNGMAQIEKMMLASEWTAGVYTIKYNWGGDSAFSASSSTGKLTLGKTKGVLWVGDRTGAKGQDVEIRALVRDANYAALPGITVTFYVNDVTAGTALSGSDGWATLKYKVPSSFNIAKYKITSKVMSAEKITAKDVYASLNVVR